MSNPRKSHRAATIASRSLNAGATRTSRSTIVNKASLIGLIILGLLTTAATASAQQVLGASAIGDQSGATAPRAPQVGPAPASIARQTAGNQPLAAWGPFEFRPHAHFTRAYNSNLKSATGTAKSTYTNTSALGFGIDAGAKWRLDYTHSWVVYADPNFRDSTSDLLSLDGAATGAGWSATVSQRYSKTDTPLVETGRQTGQESSDTSLSANWQVGPKLVTSLGAQQQLTFTKGLADVYQWTVRPSATYQVAQSITAGAALADGYVLIYRAPDSRFVRPSVQASWQMTRLTAANVEVGWDNWKYVSGNRPGTSGAYYSAAVHYAPFTQTVLTLTAQKSIGASPFRDQTTKTEGWGLTLQQRLLQHFRLSLNASDAKTAYASALLNGAIDRSDHVRTYGASLGTTFLRRGSVSVYSRFSKDTSNNAFFNFSTHQSGLEIGFRY